MQEATRNHLLRRMSPDDFALLRDGLEPVTLEVRRALERSNVPITHVYFPSSGLASIVALGGRRQRIEAGLYGRNGMSGTALLLGADRTPLETFMQIAGEGHRIAAASFLAALEASPALRVYLLRFVHALTIQTAMTALVNGHARIEERLARWLLMCHDRADGDDLTLTHEYIALMLGVRRAGVSVALKSLERRGLIAAHRGGSTIVDRKGLEVMASGFYGAPEAEYERLFG